MRTRLSNFYFRMTGGILILFVVIALGADFIANERPILYRSEGVIYWPLFRSDLKGMENWKTADGLIVFPIIPFSATKTNLSSRYLPPWSHEVIADRSHRHWLGTDRLGRDVAAGMVHGCRKSLWVGLLAMTLAAVIGVVVGAFAGFFGNRHFKAPRWLLIVILLMAAYFFYLVYYEIVSAFWLILALATITALLLFVRLPVEKYWYLPLDVTMMRTVEVISAVPTLLLLLVLTSMVSTPSLTILALIIAFLRWPRFALFVRSEVQKIKQRNDITAARVSGLSDQKILMRLILPETINSVVVVFAFGLASTIILESTLSFLGIGVPLDEVTWGSILGQAKENISAWWLAIYPGMAIFFLIIALNLMGDHLRQNLNPQS